MREREKLEEKVRRRDGGKGRWGEREIGRECKRKTGGRGGKREKVNSGLPALDDVLARERGERSKGKGWENFSDG